LTLVNGQGGECGNAV
jgi:ankyrin repeat protein